MKVFCYLSIKSMLIEVKYLLIKIKILSKINNIIV